MGKGRDEDATALEDGDEGDIRPVLSTPDMMLGYMRGVSVSQVDVEIFVEDSAAHDDRETVAPQLLF